MNTAAKPMTEMAEISLPAARLAIATAVAVILLLASLHILSPEFDPAWRVVSEYANGQYGWVLSLMFLAWAVSTWVLAFTIRSQVKKPAGKIGLGFLIAAGVGQAMASVFNINHPLHTVAEILGFYGFPVAAMLISVSLSRTQLWSASKRALLWTANLTWVILVLMIAALIAMIVTYTQAGGDPNAGVVAEIPPGVIAVVGYANRLLIAIYCMWTITVAWQAIRPHSRKFQTWVLE